MSFSLLGDIIPMRATEFCFSIPPARSSLALLCGTHYTGAGAMEKRRTEMPPGFYPRPSPETRFFAKVNKTPGCWIWTGALHQFGYGRFKDKEKQCLSHRFSWEFFFGKIPDGLWVLHRCDNPPCVNPGHLFLGNAFDNMQDCFRKGRGRIPHGRGEKNSHAILNSQQVSEIREMRKTHYISQIAVKFGVAESTISAICRGELWSHSAPGGTGKTGAQP